MLQTELDLSNRCLAVTADPGMWRSILRSALSVPSVPDGRSLEPARVSPQDLDEIASDATLDLLEYGAVVVVDLFGVEPDVFSLISWYARARPASTILIRPRDIPLAIEVRDYAVRTYDVSSHEARVKARSTIADLALVGARIRSRTSIVRTSTTTMQGGRNLRRRRTRNGVTEALRRVARALLVGDLATARGAVADALQAEPNAPDLLLRAALLHRRAGHWAGAIPALERAVRYDPDYAPAWRELGIVRQQSGVPGGEEALQRAVKIRDDYEALVALALLLGRKGESGASTQLLERAMQATGGQSTLVLPALVQRVARDGRVNVLPWERARVEEVLRIRSAQAGATPPVDAPWCYFDAARANLLLGDEEAAQALAVGASQHLTAPWQVETFATDVEIFEAAGLDLSAMRAVLKIKPGQVDSKPVLAEMEAPPPFAAAARSPDWYIQNVPCMAACPVGTDAGAYVHLLSERRIEEAFRVARGPNPFASVCGRICAAPCEDACRRGNIDEPVQIRSLKRFLTQRHGVEGVTQHIDEVLDGSPAPCIEGPAYASHLTKLAQGSTTGKRVAVVGGGPAGLACAHDLSLLGHKVTLYEAAHQLGGMMRMGIPIYRLSRDLLELETGAILSLGVDVKLGTGLNAERTLASLFADGVDAAFLASGAGRGRDLEVEGSQLDGVVRAIDFLLNANQGYRMDMGDRVIVVGGGNVALDVARTARLGRAPEKSSHGVARAQAEQAFGQELPGQELRRVMRGRHRRVDVIARQPMGEWPAQRSVHGTEELEHAREEGVVFHPLRGVRRFVGSNGRVTGVELAEVVQIYDDKGNYAPRYGAHKADVLPCDTAFLAVGQEPELDYLEGTAQVHRTSRGLIEVDRETLATSMPGVYAGGDAAFGPRTLIEAVSDGKRAARNIHHYLSGGARLEVEYSFEELHPRAVPTAKDYDVIPRIAPSCVEVGRRTGIDEVEGNYEEDEAVAQASRCLVCHVQTVYDGDLCIACGRCTDVCPFSCLSFVSPESVALKEGVLAEGVSAEMLPESDPSAVLMLKDEDRCVRCGLCAERCPTGAMTMERFDTTVQGVPS